MRTCFAVAVTVVAMVAGPTTISSSEDLPPIQLSVEERIEKYALAYGARVDLAKQIAWCESGYQNVPNAKSEIYGKGIFQFIQSTWDSHCEGDIWDEDSNIICAVKLLADGGHGHWGTQYTDWGTHHCWGHML